MMRVQFRQGLHLRWRGREYVIEQGTSGAEVQLTDQLTNTVSTIKAEVLAQFLFTGELEFVTVFEFKIQNSKFKK